MQDIVERLREDARGGFGWCELSDEAADGIERMRAEIDRLRAERDQAAEDLRYQEAMTEEVGAEIARLRAALKEISEWPIHEDEKGLRYNGPQWLAQRALDLEQASQ